MNNGVLKPRPKSGRPPHKSFNTPSKVQKALALMEDLPEGKHLQDAAKKLKCHPNTIRNHTAPLGLWKTPPKHDINANAREIKRKRLKPRIKSTTSTKVHTLFVAAEFGTKCFRHAIKVPYVNKPGKHLQNISVKGPEIARAIDKTICPWLL